MRRVIYDSDPHAQFVTFGCYHRRRLLDHPQLRDTVLEVLAASLARYDATCVGYVVMSNHVHAIVWLAEEGDLGRFMKSWKQTSSLKLKRLARGLLSNFASNDPFWQARYYPFNLYAQHKAQEKLDYMHANPVRAGLVKSCVDWGWSSARFYELGESGVVPLKWIF